MISYHACSYEYALYEESPWCALFTNKGLLFLEYREDMDDFLNDAYGNKINQKMSCPLVGDLVDKIKRTVDDVDDKYNTNLYFSHAGEYTNIRFRVKRIIHIVFLPF